MRWVKGILLCLGLLAVSIIGAGAPETEGGGDSILRQDADLKDGPPYFDDAIEGSGAPRVFIARCENAAMISPATDDGNASLGIAFYNWRGFALKGDDSHPLRVSIESIRPVEPMRVRKLLASNKSLEEIHEEIRGEDGETVYRGVMRLSERMYLLMEIDFLKLGNQTIIKADVAPFGPPPDDEGEGPDVIGSLSLSAPGDGESGVAEGSLDLSGEDAGSYRVILDAEGPRRNRPPMMLVAAPAAAPIVPPEGGAESSPGPEPN